MGGASANDSASAKSGVSARRPSVLLKSNDAKLIQSIVSAILLAWPTLVRPRLLS